MTSPQEIPVGNPVPKYVEFERVWERVNGLEERSVVSCSSGTAALHLALEAFRLEPGSFVAIPDYTMIACARAVTLAGLKPIFVDIDPVMLTISPDALDAALDTIVKQNGVVGAVMPVAVYGRPPHTDVYDVAKKYGAKIVEDLAEAHMVMPHPVSDAACWSFYKNKVIAGEEGGAVWLKDGTARYLATCLKSMGFTPDHDYTHIPRGHNYRLADALASPIIDSVRAYGENLAKRRAVESNLNVACPEEWRMPYRACPWVYDVRISGMKRGMMKRVVAALQSNGIAARFGFVPMTEQEEYLFKTSSPYNPVAAVAGQEVFYLPLGGWECSIEEAKRAFRVIQQALPAFLRPTQKI